LGQELGELRVEHAELVIPWVAHDPELEAAFVLMVPPAGAQRFKALDLGRETRSSGRGDQSESRPGPARTSCPTLQPASWKRERHDDQDPYRDRPDHR
jgi:hypothetical protein